MGTAVERAASAHAVAKQLFVVGLLSDLLEFFVLLAGWSSFLLGRVLLAFSEYDDHRKPHSLPSPS